MKDITEDLKEFCLKYQVTKNVGSQTTALMKGF